VYLEIRSFHSVVAEPVAVDPYEGKVGATPLNGETAHACSQVKKSVAVVPAVVSVIENPLTLTVAPE
jgi:hypothetical protein